MNAKLSTIQSAAPGYPPKPVYFADVSSKTMCFPSLKSYSTLDESTEILADRVAKNKEAPISPSFTPYICSGRTKWCKFNGPKYKKKKFSMDHRYYEGWHFKQDRPGELFYI